ncbi:PREDICTED: putative uncharacterized protein DDB_G0286901 [Rhagoletis zephyria]|uniref:putative uncharacterized protein DDB_G0286901 n=1 Tax=Rhagoletis zephyria TaxID=28612 RepID=UPI0008119424|nr:PREDICTED: putative uncharacterized protein DDB_G0286901 [Rhagoletis zephyria]
MMASELDKFLEMSLDEYIATKKDVFRNLGNKSIGAASKSTINTGPAFKAERRKSIDDEVEDEDEVMDNESELLGEGSFLNSSDKLNKSLGMWRGPSAETNFIDLEYMKDDFDEMFNDPELKKSCEGNPLSQQKQNNPKDLRERINNGPNSNNNKNNMGERRTNDPNANNNKNSVRERLTNGPSPNKSNNNNNANTSKQQKTPVQAPNKQNNVNANANWRSNMQTQHSMSLTSLNTEGGLSGNGQYRRRWNNNFRRRNNDGCGNRGNGFVNIGAKNMNWNNSRNGGASGMYNNNNSMNNGRIQRSNQRSNVDLNKRIKSVLEQINSTGSMYLNRQAGSVRDLTIECPSISFPGRIPTGGLQTAAQPILQNQQQQTQSDLKSLLGVNESNLKAETMAMWAGKLLDLFQSGQQQTVHKPIYDIQIQKEIHQLQGKPLFYKCPSGEVVSSDGSGVDNCKVTPSSSGVTLNYRFG